MAGKKTSEPERVSVQDVRKRLAAGKGGTVLICIYDQDDWEASHLEGSISMPEFEKRAAKLNRETEIVFY